MAEYANISDVEDRLGYALEQGVAEATAAFLEDFSLYLEAVLDGRQVPDKATKAVVARRGASFAIDTEREGATSLTQSVGDTSQTATYARRHRGDNFTLTPTERRILGIRGAGFSTWRMTL